MLIRSVRQDCSDLIISDLHAPYNHPDALIFLDAIKTKYKPRSIRNVGDEVDYHAMSFHDSDPDLMSAGHELKAAIKVMSVLHDLFPKMDLAHSNHGSMKYRKALAHGIPRHILKSYNEVLEVGDGWAWHRKFNWKLPTGQRIEMRHSMVKNVLNCSTRQGKCFIQGHYHGQFNIQYWGNSDWLNWGMAVGCLIDDESLAFAYNRVDAERPILGVGAIVEWQPRLIPMVLKSNGRWNGHLT